MNEKYSIVSIRMMKALQTSWLLSNFKWSFHVTKISFQVNLNILLLGTVKGFSWNKITFLVVVSVNNDSTTIQSRPDVYPVSNCSLAGQKINGKK